MDSFENTVASLKQYEKSRILELIDAIRKPYTEYLNPESELVTQAFADEFRSRLLLHHFFVGSPLFQESFDAAFRNAASVAGIECHKAADGTRFWDVSLDQRNISLKSTKEKHLRPDRLKISKLTEAAWIQDCRTAKRREEETKGLFREYISEVHSIFQLRYFLEQELYELVEIPVVLFAALLDVPRDFFESDGPSIDIPVGQHPPALTVKLDRSDAKITIGNIRKELCTVHATWNLRPNR